MLSEEHFFNSLSNHFSNNRLVLNVYYDKFTQERYAMFGNDDIGFPKMYLDRDKSIGNIDVYGIEFYNPKSLKMEKLFKKYVTCLNNFLISYHENKKNGYILYRRDKNYKQVRNREDLSADVFYSVFKKNHILIDDTDDISCFINSQSLIWSVYRGLKVKETFSTINSIKLQIDNLCLKEKMESHSYLIVNNDMLFNGINFKIDNIQYTVMIPEYGELYFELKISRNPKFLTLRFSEKDGLHLEEKIQEINTINRLLLLFEGP